MTETTANRKDGTMRAKYDAMIARIEARGNRELAEALAEERDEKLLALEVEQGEAETDRLLLSAGRGIAWGHWNN